MTLRQFCEEVLNELELCQGERWAVRWTELRMELSRKYAGGLIFSTSHGIDFFSNVLASYNGEAWLEEDERATGRLTNEYGRNFRTMIKQNV